MIVTPVTPADVHIAPWWAAAIVMVASNVLALWSARLWSRFEHKDTMRQVEETKQIVTRIEVNTDGRLTEALDKIKSLESFVKALERKNP